MGIREKRRASIAVTSLFLMVSVAAVDLVLPLGIAFAVLYLPAVLITLWSPGERDPLIAAALCTVLTLVGYFVSPPATGDQGAALGNCGLAIFAIWVTAIGSYQRKLVDADIRERASELRAILDTAVEGIITIDRRGHVLSINPAAESMFGYGANEVIGRNVKMLMPEPFRGEHDGYVQSYLETGEKKIIGIGREVVGLRRDGSRFPLYLGVSELQEGKGFAGILRDITVERQAQEELVESRRALDTLIANLPGIAYRCANDASRTMEFVSAGCLALTGHPPEDLVGNARLAFADVIHPEDRPRVQAEIRQALAADRAFQVSYRLVSTDGQVRWVWEQGRAVDEDAEDLEGIINDITERRRLEEEFHQSQKQEAVGRLASGIAHDFNNLLMGIIGCCRIAADGLEERSESSEQVREIREAAERGAALTRQLLTFSRRRTEEPQPILLDEVLETLETLLRRLLGEDVELVFSLACGSAVVADPGQVEQILLNLAVNARDAMPSGGTLRVATRCEPSGDGAATGDQVVLEVSDEGVGMPEAIRDKVFEPFFTTKADTEGTGLGLATVYGIVQQLGGHVQLESEVGRGTTFRIHLPRCEAPAVPLPDELEAVPPPAQGPRTILVVEDDRLVRAGIRHQLVGLGYGVLLAGDAAEALRICEETEGAIDLLLTDIVMPGMGGGELAKKVAEREPGIRTLFMSALPEEALVEQGRLDPGLPTIQKPFDEETLAARVRSLLE